MTSCRTLSLDRTCSDSPIVSFPPCDGQNAPEPCTPAQKQPRSIPRPDVEGKINIKNALQAGKSPKKDHEVERFSSLGGLEQESSPFASYMLMSTIDGSREAQGGRTAHALCGCWFRSRALRPARSERLGNPDPFETSVQAHLSRSLAAPPLDLHVLAIDWSASQKSGAERLDEVLAKARLAPVKGSLTHEVCSLDAEGVADALRRWPPRQAESPVAPPPPPSPPSSLLVALHACGDLTPDAIKAFISVNQADAKAVFVGCCYNLQTPELFPLSNLIRDKFPPSPTNSPPIMTRAHLRLTPQSPPTWHLSLASTAAWHASTLKLAFRARFEAELVAAVPQIGPPESHRIGRVSECKSWEAYRERAMRKMDTVYSGDELPELEFEGGPEGWNTAMFLLRVFWTLRSWLGPPLESLCILDRFAFLCEGLEACDGDEGSSPRRVEIVNLFEQATGSLRNMAIVVR